MINVNKNRRIGMEAEIRSYYLKEQIANKQVMACSRKHVVDGDLDLPLLKLVSEGQGTGNCYFELVFGPVENNDLHNVMRAIEIAKEINVSSVLNEARQAASRRIVRPLNPAGRSIRPSAPAVIRVAGHNVGDWVRCFNIKVTNANLSEFCMSLLPGFGQQEITILGSSRAASLQANVLVPVSSFADTDKCANIFRGLGKFNRELWFRRLGQLGIFAGAPGGSGNGREFRYMEKLVFGAAFLSIYMCVIYSENRVYIENECMKQGFILLPKVELTGALGDIYSLLDENGKRCMQTVFDLLPGLETAANYRRNMNLLLDALKYGVFRTSSEGVNISVSPCRDNVLPVHNSSEAGPCVVLEFRKGTLTVLNQICSDSLPDLW